MRPVIDPPRLLTIDTLIAALGLGRMLKRILSTHQLSNAMPAENDNILEYVKKAALNPLAARVKVVEERLKKHDEVLKDVLEIAALKEAVKRHDARLDVSMQAEKRQAAYERGELTKAYTELVNIEVAKLEKKLAKTELLEARLKGMETMIRSMEQTIDMLQRKR